MGRESLDPPPSPSPLDQSTNSFNQGAFFPTTFTTTSKKKWIALGLTAFLIIVLLIAVIILATSKPEAKTPPCPKFNYSSVSNALEGNDNGPKLEESREEGVPLEASTSTTPTTTTEHFNFDDFGDDGFEDEDDFFVVVESYKPRTSTSTTEAPVSENIEIVERKDSEDMFQPDYFYPEADNATEVTAVDGIKDPTPEDIANLLAMVDDVEQVSRLVEKFNK